mgnify:CR=1 FL=1
MTDAGRWVATALAASLLTSSTAVAAPSVVVVPPALHDDVTAVEGALRDDGHEVASWSAIAADVTAARDRARAARDRGRAEAGEAIEAAMASWLSQDFAAMRTGLLAVERDHLLDLATEPGCATLWQLQFRLGLSAGSDADARAQHYATALALDAEARPDRALYGPDVAQAFVEVVEARATSPSRTLKLTTTPADATVAVDCHEVDRAKDIAVRPGRHVVVVSAPGYLPVARLVVVDDSGAPDPIELWAASEGDPAAAFGAGWLGPWDPGGVSTRTGLRAIAKREHADVLVALSTDADGWRAQGWLVDPPKTAERTETARVRGDDATEAARRALAWVTDAGTIATPAPTVKPPTGPAGPTDTRPRRCRPAKKCWWVWTLIAVAGAGLAVGLGVGLTRRDEPGRLQIVAPGGP